MEKKVELIEDREMGIAYELWSKPEKFLQEGTFEYEGEIFKYKIKCPVCPMSFLNNNLERLLKDVSNHAFEHLWYFYYRNKHKKVVKVR
jgi:hypothetical protein